MKALSTRFALALTLALAATPVARAEQIFGDGVVSAFEGSVTYSASSSTSATLVVSLTNTSPLTVGHLTGFAFNNPNNQIAGVSLDSTAPGFALLGGPSFQDGVQGFPYGSFDFGASTGGTVAGEQGLGLAPGETATFTFSLTGTDLDQLNVAKFFETLSGGAGSPEFAAFVAIFRYQDSVVFVPAALDSKGDPADTAPEPGSMLLGGLGAGLAGLAALRRYRRARRACA